jgi:hypothetical protein
MVTHNEYLLQSIKGCLSCENDSFVLDVERRCRSLLETRALARKTKRENLQGGFTAFAKFMGNVAQAMALRQVLRWSKGHPGFGTNPASGEMWLPLELINASNRLTNSAKPRVTYTDWNNQLEKINPFYTKINSLSLMNSLQTVLRNNKPKEEAHIYE